MINTIFYFANNQAEYLDNWNRGEVKPHTICFAADTNTIWRNGLRYSGMRKSEIDPIVNDIEDRMNESEELARQALNDLEDRINEFDSQNKQALDNAVQRIENSLDQSVNQLNQTVDRVQQDLDNIIDDNRSEINLMINNVINSKGFIDGWQAGWDQNLNAYLIQVGVLGQNGIDKGWSYLETKYNEIRAEVDAISAGTDTQILQSLIDARIEGNSSIAELKARYALTNQDQVVLKWLSGGFYTEANANKSVSQVFASAEDVANNTQAISALQTTVNQLENGDWSASIDLSSYVKKEDLDGEVSESISGLFTENSTNSAIADVFSRLKNTETKTGETTTAVSGLTSRVTNLEQNGAPVTESSLISGINVNKDEIVDILSQAGLVNTATLNSAEQSLGSRITNAENTASGAASAVSGLTTRVESLEEGGYISENTLVAAIKNKKDQIVSLAGLVDTASLDSAESTLGARITGTNNAVSGLTTRVQNIENAGYISESSLVSAIKNKADSIVSEAGLINTAKLNLATSGLIAADKLNDYTAEIIANVNNSGSSVLLNADKIYLNGQTWAEFITALGITANQLRVTDSDGYTVSELKNDGTAQFMDYRVQIPYLTRHMSTGEILNETGVVVKSKDGSHKTFYQAGGFNNQAPTGVISSSIFGSKADNNGSSLVIANYGSTFNTANYDQNVSISMSRGLQTSDASGVGYFSIANLDGEGSHSGTGMAEIIGWDIIRFATNNLESSVSLTVSSDERLKTIVSDVSPKVEDIAKTRTVDFYYSNDSNKHVRTGSIAQDWQKIIPNAVQADKDGMLSLDYASAALVSVVSVAKELVELKKENEELKQRLADIESKLATI